MREEEEKEYTEDGGACRTNEAPAKKVNENGSETHVYILRQSNQHVTDNFEEHSSYGDIGNGDVVMLHDPGIGNGLVETTPQALNAEH